MIEFGLLAWLAFSLECPGIGWIAVVCAILKGAVGLANFAFKLGKETS